MSAIPDDIMATAWPIALSAISQPQTVEAAQFAIARAVLAERQRCAAAVVSERIFDVGESLVGADPTDISYDLALCHAVAAIEGAPV